MMRISPYIFFNGNCEEAMTFYSQCLNAPITDLSRFGNAPVPHDAADNNKIMHARINVGLNNVIMVCDNMNKNTDIGSNVQLSVEFEDLEEMNNKFEKITIGGTVTMPLQDTFWGARFGMFKDKFGIFWMFSCQIKK